MCRTRERAPEKLDLSLYDLAYEFGVQECVNDRGQTYYAPTFTFIGAAGSPEGPSEEEALSQLRRPVRSRSRPTSPRRSGRPRVAEAQSSHPTSRRAIRN